VSPEERTYRLNHNSAGLIGFEVAYNETDLHVQAMNNCKGHALELIKKGRHYIETYARLNPGFLQSLSPLPEDPSAPDIVQEMLAAGRIAGTGPMAAVAGAIAKYVGEGILPENEEVIVENGGDIYICLKRSFVAGIYAGDSVFSKKVGMRIETKGSAVGLCTSSGSIGHSLSFGKADAVTVLAASPVLADAAATAACNMVRTSGDIKYVMDWIRAIQGVMDCVIILGDKLSAFGDLELVSL
jgi:ApbE superfamily uncharacterized protein (UPF0280 family)